MGDEATVEVCRPASEIEAIAIEAELADHGIDAQIVSFRTGVRPDQVQPRHGWGRIRVIAREADRARAIVDRWRREHVPMDEDALAELALEGVREEPETARVQRGSPYRGGPDARGGAAPQSKASLVAAILLGSICAIAIAAALFRPSGW